MENFIPDKLPTKVTLEIPNTESLGELKDMRPVYNMTAKYRTQEEWMDYKDEPIRAYYLGIKEIPNPEGEMVACAVFATESEVFLSGQMVLVDAAKKLANKTPVEITYLGKKRNKKSGSTNMFDVVILGQ